MSLFPTVSTLITKWCFKNSDTNILQKYVITQPQTMYSSPSHPTIIPVWNTVQSMKQASKTPAKKTNQAKFKLTFTYHKASGVTAQR